MQRSNLTNDYLLTIIGSVAAGVQSMIGNVAASSAFATLQSAGVGGYGVAAVTTASQAAGAVMVSTGAGVLAWLKRP